MAAREQPHWVGTALNNFTVSSGELEHSVESGKEWREKIDIEKWDEDGNRVLRISPFAADTRTNSIGSGDENILHDDHRVVREFIETYPDAFAREPAQEEDVLINQGMSALDALIPELERPLKRAGGTWKKMVYSVLEGGTPDKLTVYEQSPGNYSMKVAPGGGEETMDAGELETGFLEDSVISTNKHNQYFNSLMDLAVGRGFEEPQIRNGELLMSNNIELLSTIGWEEIQEYAFRLEDVEQLDTGVKASWTIDAVYGENDFELDVAEYEETSLYIEDFEELEALENPFDKLAESTVVAPYRAATETAEVTAEATADALNGNPGAATMRVASVPAVYWGSLLS